MPGPDATPTGKDALDGLARIVGSVRLGPKAEALGRVIRIADGLADVSGLWAARLGKLLDFGNGKRGFVLTLEPKILKAVLLDHADGIEAGATVRRTDTLASVPVGEALLGRVVDPLGRPLDECDPIAAEQWRGIEHPARAIFDRDFVSKPVETGMLAIDAPERPNPTQQIAKGAR